MNVGLDRAQSSIGVVEIVDSLRHAGADAGDALQVLQSRRTHLACSAEMQQQSPLASRADAGNFIER